ncbi:S-layer homology domain-containing protein [Paenibacillus sp. FSL W8-1187]|uniref:S-layer homology domain-containing protein n=1 Tax=Paenibacillus sp. FSL W8-1187 TaxID=2975339 RepID=UPI0030D90F68
MLLGSGFPAPQGVRAQASVGGTYFTDTDNWGGGAAGSAPDGDLDYATNRISNGHALYPIELKIENVDKLPAESARLLIRAYDVDEYDGTDSTSTGEWDRIYLSDKPEDIVLGNPYTPWKTTGGWSSATASYKKEFKQSAYVGALSGANEKWNTTVLSVDPDRIKLGDQYVGASIHHYFKSSRLNAGWVTEIDWAQLVVDGGIRDKAEFSSAGITVKNGKISIDSAFLGKAGYQGPFSLEANVIQEVTDADGTVREVNLALDSKRVASVDPGEPGRWSLDLENPDIRLGEDYRINLILFEDRGGNGSNPNPGKVQHLLDIPTSEIQMLAEDFRKPSSVFAAEDFRSSFFKTNGVEGADALANGANLEKIRIASLPDPQDGELMYDGVPLSAADIGKEIAIANVSKLGFRPASTTDGEAEFGWTGFAEGKYASKPGQASFGVNRAPIVESLSKPALKGETLSFSRTDFAQASAYVDPEQQPLAAIMVTQLPDPAKGKLYLKRADAPLVPIVAGMPIAAADLDRLVFQPEAGATGTAEFRWNGSDGELYAAADKTVHIRINTPPVGADLSRTGPMGAPIGFAAPGGGSSFAALYGDEDGDAFHSAAFDLPAGFAAKGTLSYTDPSTTETVYAEPGRRTLVPALALESLRFVPAPGLANGAAVDIPWRPFDGKQLAEQPSLLRIAYDGIPRAEWIFALANEGVQELRLIPSGTDQETVTGLVYRLVPDSGPSRGTLVPDVDSDRGGWIYTPDKSFVGGTDSFRYVAVDESGQVSEPATATIIIHKALDGWAGDKPQGDPSRMTALPGYPVRLSAVSSLAAEKVTASLAGAETELVWINPSTSQAEGVKRWEKEGFLLPQAAAGEHEAAFTAYGPLGQLISNEEASRRSDNWITVLTTRIALTADPDRIVGDGSSTSVLTAAVTDESGGPVSGVSVSFAAGAGSFPDGVTAVTGADGKASVVYRSAAMSGTAEQRIPVTAKVLDLVRGLAGEKGIELTFLPARIQGVLTSGSSNAPVAGAIVRAALDLNGDGVIEPGVDFEASTTTDERGRYSLAVPKGDAVYELAVTQLIEIGGVPTPVTYTQKAVVGHADGTGEQSFESEKTVSGIVLLKQPDGGTAKLDAETAGRSSVYFKDSQGKYVTDGSGAPKAHPLSAQGVFSTEGLPVGSYAFEIRYEFEPGVQAVLSVGQAHVKADGELNLLTQLVDPYGTVSDASTGAVIEGATVMLHYADTGRNKAAGKAAGSGVVLPALVGFEPNDNASPLQMTDKNGFYAYMVYPETDYYLVVSKAGYETYRSPVISVEWDIVKHDLQLRPLSAPAPQPPARTGLAVEIASEQMVVREESESLLTVTYKNSGSDRMASGTVEVVLPDGASFVRADGAAIEGAKAVWSVKDLAAGQTGQLQLTVRWPRLDAKEKDADITAAFFSGDASAKSVAKFKLYSDRFEPLFHSRYIRGYPDGEFKPGQTLTRAEVAAVTARLSDGPADDAKAGSFRDIRSGHWAEGYIRESAAKGYFKGGTDGRFRPDAPVTRAELVVVLSRFLGLEPGEPAGSRFLDTAGHWAEKEIEALRVGKYLNGYPDGSFRPNQPIRRDEAVALINGMLRRGPLAGVQPLFPDMPQGNWAYGAVMEASLSHESERVEDGSERLLKAIEDHME